MLDPTETLVYLSDALNDRFVVLSVPAAPPAVGCLLSSSAVLLTTESLAEFTTSGVAPGLVGAANALNVRGGYKTPLALGAVSASQTFFQLLLAPEGSTAAFSGQFGLYDTTAL